ncbi:MAG: KTSC domain-containing protein [Ginsengibacter sp.]
MKLPDKYAKRLHTDNFRQVTSKAIASLDYKTRSKILEIVFRTGHIYHYTDINKKIWQQISKFADRGEGLGTYVNQNFKSMVEEEHKDYYEVIKG